MRADPISKADIEEDKKEKKKAKEDKAAKAKEDEGFEEDKENNTESEDNIDKDKMETEDVDKPEKPEQTPSNVSCTVFLFKIDIWIFCFSVEHNSNGNIIPQDRSSKRCAGISQIRIFNQNL